MTDRPDLTVAELVSAARGHAIDLGLVEDRNRTLHLPDCHALEARSSHPQRIPLEAVDCFPFCDWCLLQINTPSLGDIVRLGPDISTVARLVHRPSAAWAVALDGLRSTHEGVKREFHPALKDFGESQHRLNERGIRTLEAAIQPGCPSGRLLRSSALRVALIEATVAVITGCCDPGDSWGPVAEKLAEAVPLGPDRLAPMLLRLADWESTRTVARPVGQEAWSHVPNPPTDEIHRLIAMTDLDPAGIEALAVELTVADMMALLAEADVDRLDGDVERTVVIGNGPRLRSAGRQLAWRRGRIHWLRGLVDLGLLGRSTARGRDGTAVEVPSVVAAAMTLPTRMVGSSPVVASPHDVMR